MCGVLFRILGDEAEAEGTGEAEATEELIFETDPDEMWEAAIRSLGIDPVTLFPGTGIH